MLTPREKSPLPKMSPEEDRTRDAVDSELKHYQLSYSGPLRSLSAGEGGLSPANPVLIKWLVLSGFPFPLPPSLRHP